MRKLVITEFMSLDGVIEAPGGENDFEHGAWTIPFWSDQIGAFKDEELKASEISLLGRVTYDGFSAAWPERGGQGDPFADKINSMRKVVASTTLTDPSSSTRASFTSRMSWMPCDLRWPMTSLAFIRSRRMPSCSSLPLRTIAVGLPSRSVSKPCPHQVSHELPAWAAARTMTCRWAGDMLISASVGHGPANGRDHG